MRQFKVIIFIVSIVIFINPEAYSDNQHTIRSFNNWKHTSYEMIFNKFDICGSDNIAVDGEEGIKLLDIKSGDITLVSNDRHDLLSGCSEDGELLFYNTTKIVNNTKMFELYAYDIINKTTEKISTAPYADANFRNPLSPNGKYMFCHSDNACKESTFQFRSGKIVTLVPDKIHGLHANFTYFDMILMLNYNMSSSNNYLEIKLHNINTQEDSTFQIDYPNELCGGLSACSKYSNSTMFIQTYYCGSAVDPVRIGPKSIPATYKLTILRNGEYTLDPISYKPDTVISPTGRISFSVDGEEENDGSIFVIINDGDDNVLIGEIDKTETKPDLEISRDGNMVVCKIFLDHPSWLPRTPPISSRYRLVVFHKNE